MLANTPSVEIDQNSAVFPRAIKPEIIMIIEDVNEVACDGGHPVLGHPLTYYSFDGSDVVECGYCNRRFVKKLKQ